MGDALVTYPEGPHYRFRDTLTPTVLALDSSGYPVISTNVTLTWVSGSWNDFTGNQIRTQTVATNNEGKATFNLTVPTSLGYHSYLINVPITFRHYYDIDGILFTSGSANEQMIVYHFQMSDYISS